MLSHLLRSLASQTSDHGGKNIAGLLQEPQKLLNDGTSVGNSDVVSTFIANSSQGPPRPIKQHQTVSVSEIPQQGVHLHNANGGSIQATSSVKPSILNSPPSYSEARDGTTGQIKMNNFDLNDIYIDSDDSVEDPERSPPTTNAVTSSLDCPSWVQQDSHQSSPPQTSGNSDSASAQSPSSSSGEAQVLFLSQIYSIHLYKRHSTNKYPLASSPYFNLYIFLFHIFFFSLWVIVSYVSLKSVEAPT